MQTEKDSRFFVGIVIICGAHNYCIPLSSPKEKHKKIKYYKRLCVQELEWCQRNSEVICNKANRRWCPFVRGKGGGKYD